MVAVEVSADSGFGGGSVITEGGVVTYVSADIQTRRPAEFLRVLERAVTTMFGFKEEENEETQGVGPFGRMSRLFISQLTEAGVRFMTGRDARTRSGETLQKKARKVVAVNRRDRQLASTDHQLVTGPAFALGEGRECFCRFVLALNHESLYI